jgi:RimJ/RimL family protein N-acetyltransferase/ribosomal protein S18 acetylase RimI-like enzyme
MKDTDDRAVDGPVGPPVATHPARRPVPTTLKGRFVTLAPLDVSHAESLYADTHGPRKNSMWRYLFDGPFEDLESFRASIASKATSADPLFFAILDAAGTCVGHVTLMRIDEKHRVIETGNIIYGASLQRTPGATEAMYLLARHVFDDLGYRRYEWKCNSLNAPSRVAARRLGFEFEGIFRQHMIVKGRNRDTAWYAMLDTEWPLRKRAFERWLSPANFTPDGQQRVGLSVLNRREADIGGATLRRATLADLDAIAALQTAAYVPNEVIIQRPSLPRIADFSAMIHTHEFWLAFGEADLAAVLILDPAEHFSIWSIAVAPAGQARGLGNGLMAFAELRAAELGYREVRLFTNEKLTRQINWYTSLGFQKTHVEIMPDRRAVHMTKPLRQNAANKEMHTGEHEA